MGNHTAWTYQLCAESAAGYKGRGAWARDHYAAYKAARKNGWIDSIFPTRLKAEPKSWDFESCVKSASAFSGKGDWSKAEPSAYQAAWRAGWLDAIFPTRKGRATKWTLDSCMEKAKEYSFQKQWQQEHPPSFYAAYRGGWLEHCTSHMRESPRSPSDNDCIYIWRSQVPSVYKVGVTSKRLGTERISICASRSSMSCEEVILLEPVRDARQVEKHILSIGVPFTGALGDGRTEFRVFSESDISEAKLYAQAA